MYELAFGAYSLWRDTLLNLDGERGAWFYLNLETLLTLQRGLTSSEERTGRREEGKKGRGKINGGRVNWG